MVTDLTEEVFETVSVNSLNISGHCNANVPLIQEKG